MVGNSGNVEIADVNVTDVHNADGNLSAITLSLGDTTLENQIAQAKKQLNQYDMGSKYIKVVLVFKGWELVHCEEEK